MGLKSRFTKAIFISRLSKIIEKNPLNEIFSNLTPALKQEIDLYNEALVLTNSVIKENKETVAEIVWMGFEIVKKFDEMKVPKDAKLGMKNLALSFEGAMKKRMEVSGTASAWSEGVADFINKAFK